MRRKPWRILTALIPVLLICADASAATTRILMFGDSHTFFPYFAQSPPALSAAFAQYGQGLEQWSEDGSLSLVQKCPWSTNDYCATSEDWDENEELRTDIRNMLLIFPEIDIIHMSLGLNDLHSELGGHHDDPVYIEQLFYRTEKHLENLIEFCLDLRPDVRILLFGSDYPNITEGFGIAEDGSLYSTTEGLGNFYEFFGWSPATIFEVLAYQKIYTGYYLELHRRKLEIARRYDRVEFANNHGVLQAHYGIPSLGISPTYPEGMPGGLKENYIPFAPGHPDLFTPMEVMAPSDSLHYSPEGYLKVMKNVIDQFYADWLRDTEGPRCTRISPAGGTLLEANTGTAFFEVDFSEPVTGVDVKDFRVESDISCASVVSVTGSGTHYEVEVDTRSGGGALRVDLIDNDTIYDAVWIPLGKLGLLNVDADGDFTNGDTLLIDGALVDEECPPVEGEPDPLVLLCEWELDGNAVRPDPVTTAATGTGYFYFDSVTGVYYLEVTHDVTNPAGAFLHTGNAASTGSVVLDLGDPESPVYLELSDLDMETLLFNPDLYVEIEGAFAPQGEIRGQLPHPICLSDTNVPRETVVEIAREVLSRFRRFDLNFDTHLSPLEAIEPTLDFGVLDALAVFLILDFDGDAGIEIGELRQFAGEGHIHALDINGDHHLNLRELLRLIQFYNGGGYSCSEGGPSEDGYNFGASDADCVKHSSDFDPPDFRVSLTELLRAVQIFNNGRYDYCPDADTEDGYCL